MYAIWLVIKKHVKIATTPLIINK